MRHLLGSLVAALALASLAGCASAPKTARAPSAPSGDVVAQMNTELSHTLDTEPVGTTVLTNGDVETSTETDTMPLPPDRMSLKMLQTEPVPSPQPPSVPSSGN